MKNIEIERYGVKIEMENILITDFGEFLQSQIYLSKEQKKMLANNLFENQHS